VECGARGVRAAGAALGEQHRQGRQLHLQLHLRHRAAQHHRRPGLQLIPKNFLAPVLCAYSSWDPNNTIKHIGVNVNNISSAAYTALPDWCFNGTTMSAWVGYDADVGTLSATLRLDDQSGLLSLYNVSAPVDFRAAGLKQQAAVGFSVATGDLVERHQILSWSFESNLANVAVVNKPAKWLLHFLILFLLLCSV